ncbi:hypothetical protein [Candidatus Protochlamydia phocaeensis]|uniref:hypothetical protein n=1 Tax=Candidatus Protochlamydia phocaeensis TaxID=1414722 RepID=UPI0008393ACD|nr:hypothetical protein [Candidatus Protochlamydia phocaeensis]
MTIQSKQDPATEQAEEKLKQIKATKNKNAQSEQLKELVKSCAAKRQWHLVTEAIEVLEDEKERNLLIADLIEDTLLNNKEIDQAKKFAKYLMPQSEIQPLVMIRIALAENNQAQALHIADSLPSPLSRNFALWHIAEFYLSNKDKNKAYEIGNKMLDNVRTIYDARTRSYVLREIAIELFLAKQDKERAREVANLIPNEEIKKQLLSKIDSAK